MFGIADGIGIMFKSERTLMTQSLKYRGLDHLAYESFNGIYFAKTGSSIIDLLDDSNQPL